LLPVARRVLILQHGEKERTGQDAMLTAVGVAQAAATAEWITANESVAAGWSSPYRRATASAAAIARAAGLDVVTLGLHREARRLMPGGDAASFSELLAGWCPRQDSNLRHTV
jgi:broad specificity phosphatase PhoE